MSQEVVYADNLVTVHRPIFTGAGSVTYNGGVQQVTYTDRNGTMRTINGVDTFNQFSGGDVTTTMSPDNAAAEGPGKMYVSEDMMTVTFSTSNIITPDIVDLIRDTPTDFTINADQFSSIYNGVFNFSMDTATVTYPGGGIIWYSTFGTSRDSFYVDDESVSRQIQENVGSLFITTKSVPAKDLGLVRVIFNGRSIYTYSPITGNREIFLDSTDSFTFVNMDLVGPSLPNGIYRFVNMLIVFDGVEVKQVNSSSEPKIFDGSGFLLLQPDSDIAFYTTFPPTVDYLSRSIAILKGSLVPPRIQPGKGSITTKNRAASVYIGTDVTAFQGADVSFKCNVVAGRPEPSVDFFIMVGDQLVLLNNTVDRIIGNNTLTLLDVHADDEGEYVCIASNGVSPDARASSTLNVRGAVAPVLQPGWFPFDLTSGQKILFPDFIERTETVDLREFSQLIFACRVDGNPKAEVIWLINDVPIFDTVLTDYLIFEVVEGRSVLIFDLRFFNETGVNPLLGLNTISCFAENEGGFTAGSVRLRGEIIQCDGGETGPECSTTCGFGLTDTIFTCERFIGPGMSEDIDIVDVPLRVVPLIDRTRICTTSEGLDVVICPLTEYRWNVSEWSGCSRTCNGGFRTRNVSCLNESFPIDSRYFAQVDSVTLSPADDYMCTMSEKAGERPADRELCETQDCPFFLATEFGEECSATCGGGMRRVRNVTCVILNGRYKDMNNKTQLNVTVVDDIMCFGQNKPTETIECNTFPCFTKWTAGQYGDCGATSLPVADEFPYCRERPVTCVDDKDIPTNDSFCDANIRPSSVASCGDGRCFVGVWGNPPFSKCSLTCGYGVEERQLTCYSPRSLTEVPTDFCDVAIRPMSKRPCFIRNCENTCLRDENRNVCRILANIGMCGSPYAMGNNGTRCCVSCMGMAGGD
jgi:hypothetical protein